MKPVFLSVVIVNYNSGPRLEKCLAHLKAQTLQNFEVIVVDNGSTDNSAQYVTASDLDAKLILAGENLGFAAANNLAVKSCRGDWLAFLNPDAYANPDWTAQFIDGLARHRDVEAFGSAQIDANAPSRLDGAGDDYHICAIPYRGYFGWPVEALPGDGEVFAPCAAAAFYKTATFRALGGFDARFFCYCEDVDLGYRLRLTGGRTVQLSGAIVHHEGSAISGRRSDFTVYHGHRNRIWTAYKNTPFWLYWPFLPLHFLANLYLLILSPIRGTSRPFIKGLIDGYGGLYKFRADRKALQKQRKVSYKSLAQIMTWSPFKLLARQGRTVNEDKSGEKLKPLDLNR